MSYLPLFVPYLLSYLLQDTPTVSYWVAWAGSVFILWYSLSGHVRPLPGGRALRFQLFRPIVFTQIVFATYTALTSVFYFLALSRGGLSIVPDGWAPPSLDLAARAQGYYVLAHASLTAGMFLAMSYSDSGLYALKLRFGHARFLLAAATVFFLLTMLAHTTPALFQVEFRFRQVATAAAVFSFAIALINREATLIWLNAGVFGLSMVSALLSGWKEEVLVLLILFFVVLFPYYRRVTILIGSVCFAAFLVVMPAYSAVYRSLAWYGQNTPEEASRIAYEQIISGNVNLLEMSEAFARDRLSEIGLFVGYLQQVPAKRPFYEGQLLRQSVMNLTPRLLWPEKPNTEFMVMERVFENKIYSRLARISAKPQFVVDAYLSAGALGIFFACLTYGVLASVMSRLAERWFGGYLMGSGLAYTGLFQIFWRGNAFEFFVGTVFWSFIMMVMMFQLARSLGILKRDFAVRPPPRLRAVPAGAVRPNVVTRDPPTVARGA